VADVAPEYSMSQRESPSLKSRSKLRRAFLLAQFMEMRLKCLVALAGILCRAGFQNRDARLQRMNGGAQFLVLCQWKE
jgi:hypothetical protein